LTALVVVNVSACWKELHCRPVVWWCESGFWGRSYCVIS